VVQLGTDKATRRSSSEPIERCHAVFLGSPKGQLEVLARYSSNPGLSFKVLCSLLLL